MIKDYDSRNWKIMQLRGVLPRLTSIIPDDIKARFTDMELLKFQTTADRIIHVLNQVKVIRFVCAGCKNKATTKLTKNKKAITCDICGDWRVEELYIYKEIG